MRDEDIWPHLWLQPSNSGIQGEVIKPHVPYVLATKEKIQFVEIIRNLKTPTNYVSALWKRIHNDGTLRGLKSHNYHIMMQQVLLLCLRSLMARGPRMALMKLSRVFRKICSKIVDSTAAETLKEDVAVALCLLEKEFPPAFFDPMTHLLVHLVEELDICGPVHS